MILFAILLLFVAGSFGLKLVINPPEKPNMITYFVTTFDNNGVPTIDFDRLLVLYTWTTFVTAFAALLIDIGKMWSIVGLSHTTLELAILVLLGNGGKIKNVTFLAWMLFYILLVGAICIFSDFPTDALFFKFQG